MELFKFRGLVSYPGNIWLLQIAKRNARLMRSRRGGRKLQANVREVLGGPFHHDPPGWCPLRFGPPSRTSCRSQDLHNIISSHLTLPVPGSIFCDLLSPLYIKTI